MGPAGQDGRTRGLKRLLLLALLLAGCAHPPGDVLRIATGDSGDGLDSHRKIIQLAEARGLHCRLEPVSGGDYYTRLLTQLASSDPPDLIQLGDDAVPPFVDRGCLQPLGKDFPTAEFLPEVVNPGRWKGQLYMLPKDYTTFGVYCNLKLFKQFGVALPTPDWTTEDFLKAAQALTRDVDGDGHTDVWGLILPGATPATLELWAGLYGGRVVDDEGDYSGSLDSPETLAGLQFWASLYHQHKVVPLPLELGSDSSGNFQFEQGKAAMRLSGRWYLPSLRTNPLVELAVLPPPQGTRRANLLYWAGFGIARECKHPREAGELLRLYTGPQASAIWKDWALPAVRSVAVEAGFTTDPLEKVWLDQLRYVITRAYVHDPYWSQVGDRAVRTLLETALLQPDADLGSVARAIATQAQQEVERLRRR